MFGTSTWVGKAEIKTFLQRYLKPGMKICDMGAGSGTYYNILGNNYEWTAVEIWHDAAEALKKNYNYVYEQHICDFVYPQNYDLVIFGDVLEHLTVKDAQYAVQEAEHHSKAILIAIPYLYKQGAIYGNNAEIHLQDNLTPKLFKERYPGYQIIYGNKNLAYYWKQI